MPFIKEIDYSFATQRLRALGNSVYIKDKKILQYAGGMPFPLKPFKTRISKGDVLLDKEQQIKIINNDEDLSTLKYCLVSEAVVAGDYIYFEGQKKKFKLQKLAPTVKGVKFSTGYCVEFDVINRAIRLRGQGAGEFGVGKWVKLWRAGQVSQDPNDILRRRQESLTGISSVQKTIFEYKDVPEIAFMVSDEGELICLPNQITEPTIGVIGAKGSGKTFGLHRVVDCAYWKLNKGIIILNDWLDECNPWALPWMYLNSNNKTEMTFAKQLKKIGEETRPLPVVFLTPVTESMDEVTLPHSGVSFKMSFPLKELIANYYNYLKGKREWELRNSGRYFKKLIPLLAELFKTDDDIAFEDIEVIVKSELNHKTTETPQGVAEKILSVLEDVYQRGILDANTNVPSKWKVRLKNGHVGEYFPPMALALCGVVPVIKTMDLNKKDYFQQYKRYELESIYNTQKKDLYCRANGTQVWVIVDELPSVTSTSQSSLTREITESFVTEGRPVRVGFGYGTQNYTLVPKRIRSNTKFLFAFQAGSDEEAKAVAQDFTLSKTQRQKLLNLEPLELVALTKEHFICYDSEGNRRESKRGEIFKGRILPPLSMHQAPTKQRVVEDE